MARNVARTQVVHVDDTPAAGYGRRLGRQAAAMGPATDRRPVSRPMEQSWVRAREIAKTLHGSLTPSVRQAYATSGDPMDQMITEALGELDEQRHLAAVR